MSVGGGGSAESVSEGALDPLGLSPGDASEAGPSFLVCPKEALPQSHSSTPKSLPSVVMDRRVSQQLRDVS